MSGPTVSAAEQSPGASVPEVLAAAVGHHQAGRLPAAEEMYRRVLVAEPHNADALHLLGVIAHQVNQHDAAAEYVLQALSHAPNQADYYNTLGNARRGQGRLDEAIDAYQQALRVQPALVEAHYNLGNSHLLKKAPEAAEACFRRVLELAPGHVEAHVELGNARQKQGSLDDALACFRRALNLKPDCLAAQQYLGSVLAKMGRLDDALAALSRALVLEPANAITLGNLGNVYSRKADFAAAIACYHLAIQCRPDFISAHYGLGNALYLQNRVTESIDSFQRVLELQPDHIGAMCNLVMQRLSNCDWRDVPALSQQILDVAQSPQGTSGNVLSMSISSLVAFYLPVKFTAELHLKIARHRATLVARSVEKQQEPRPWQNPAVPKAKPKLTIGYLSADFRVHAVAFLVAELFEQHDRSRFQTIAYSYGENDGSPMRKRLEQGVDQFVDIRSWSHADAARRIAADNVDILVDLTGYTRDGRTEIPALRPAPIQVNFLGFPGTMGASFIDYILVDKFVVPSDQQPFYAEKLVHLPGSYQVNDSRREVAPTPTRAQCGLPESGFVFCSFNNNFKITLDIFEIWMRMLQAVPGSVLWLYEGNSVVAGNLRREAAAAGVEASRLVFARPLPNAKHLARQKLADLFLDTFPYTSHTVASDALWAGCPLITIAGDTFASRVAGSLLTTLGLPELVTRSHAEYEQLALHLALNPARLSDLRTRLDVARTTSSLFNAEHFARKIERAYARMWEIYAAGEQPRAFRVEEARD